MRLTSLRISEEFASVIAAGVDRLFQTIEFSVDLAGETWPDIGLDHQRYPSTELTDSLGGFLDDGEDFVPLTLDGREHRIRPVRQTRVADDLDSRRDGVVNRCIGPFSPAGGD